MPHLFQFDPKNIPPKLSGAIVGNTLIEGGKPAAWWRKQSGDFRLSFVRTMRTSMQNGEGVTQALRRLSGGVIDGVTVPGIMKTTRARAGALASTSMNAFSNQARIATYQANNDVVKGTQQLSTLDNLTSDICIAYSGQAWNVTTFQPIPPSTLPFNGGPPRHFNCRSTLVPVLKSFQELGLTQNQAAGFPAGTRASMDGQVPGDTSFGNFLSGKSKKFQDKLLGPARAKLWRNNDITLTQLVDMRGNPMTLAQLEQKLNIPIKGALPPATVVPKAPPDVLEAGALVDDVPDVGERTFVKARVDKGEALVQVKAKDLESGWSRDQGYIPADLSKNTIGTRIKTFDDFLKDEPIIEVANVSVRKNGLITFGNGRHRTRVLLNQGMDDIPMTMSKESLKNFEKHYLTKAKRPPVPSKAEIKRIEQLRKQAERARIAKFKAEQAARKAAKAAEEAAEAKAQNAALRKAAASAKKAKERAKRKAANAEAPPQKPTDKDHVIITDPSKVQAEANRYLKSRGVADEDLFVSEETLELLELSDRVSFGLQQKEALFDIIQPALKRLAAKRLAIQAAIDGTFEKLDEVASVVKAHLDSYGQAPSFIRAAIGRRRAMSDFVTDYKITRKQGDAFYRDSKNEIFINKQFKNSEEAFNAIWRHEYGHALDYGLADDYYRMIGKKAPIDKWGQKNISGRETNKFILRDNKAATAFLKPGHPGSSEFARGAKKHLEAAGKTKGSVKKYYNPLLKKHGMEFSDIEPMLKRNFTFRGEKLERYMHDEFLPSLLSSMETGVMNQFLRTATASGMYQGGADFAMLSDYFSAITKNKVRGNFGHSNAYYRQRHAKHKEAWANAVSMMSSVDAPFYRALLKAYGTDHTLLEIERILKALEAYNG